MKSTTPLRASVGRRSLPFYQHHHHSAGADQQQFLFRGIPGGSSVEKARQQRRDEDARERKGVEGGMKNSKMYVDPAASSSNNDGASSSALTLSNAKDALLDIEGGILVSDNSFEANAARNRRYYVKVITSDFHNFAKVRPIPQAPWLQDIKRTYLDDAERAFGRKEGWHLHPDPATRSKLLSILSAFIRDTIDQSNDLRRMVKPRREKLARLRKEYAHYALVAAYNGSKQRGGSLVDRFKREWRVPKTAEDLLREEEARENGPMLELIEAAKKAREEMRSENQPLKGATVSMDGHVVSGQPAASVSDMDFMKQMEASQASATVGADGLTEDERYLRNAEVRSRLAGTAAIDGDHLTSIDPFHPGSNGPVSPITSSLKKKKTQKGKSGEGAVDEDGNFIAADDGITDMAAEGLLDNKYRGTAGAAVADVGQVRTDIQSARASEKPNQFPFLRQRVAEGDTHTLDASLVDWTQSFFPEDDETTFAEPKAIQERHRMLVEQDKKRQEEETKTREARVMAIQKKHLALSSSSPSPSLASSLDDVDSDKLELLRERRAAQRLDGASASSSSASSGGDVLRQSVFDDDNANADDGNTSEETRRKRQQYEEALFNLQAKTREQLDARRRELKKRKQQEERDRRRSVGRFSLTQSLEKFVEGRLGLFDGEGMYFQSPAATSSSATSSSSHRPHQQQHQQYSDTGADASRIRRDHQGIPLAERPKGLRTKKKAQAIRVLLGDKVYGGGGGGGGGGGRADGNAFLNGRMGGGLTEDSFLEQFGRFGGRGSRFAHQHNFDDNLRNRRNADDDGAFVPTPPSSSSSSFHHKRDRHHPPTKRINVDDIERAGGGGGRGADIKKVDWQTTVLSQNQSAGLAGPKWHRANERLVRIARGERQ